LSSLKRSFFAQYWNILVLAAIILGGCVFYFGAVEWGFPALLYPDEYTIVDPAVRMVENHSFEPDVYYRPDHLLIQINAILFNILAHVRGTPIIDIFEGNPALLHGIARAVSAAFMIGCIIAAYCIGRERNVWTGLIVAFLLALFPVMQPYAHISTSDVPTTFFMLLFILVAIYYLRSPGYRNLILLCLIIAAFTCIKYTGLILLFPLAVTVIMATVRDKAYIRILKHAVATIVLVFAFIFLISPIL
jgi:4-amino-4-deoxy-L-arabinose transferase-like glycosyltransferase